MARGGLWSVGGQVAVLLASLIATPFVVRLLAPELYGLLALIQALIAYIGFAGVGTALASTKFGADALARHDDDGEVAVVWTSLVIVAVPAVLVGLVFAAAAHTVMRALSVPPHLQAEGVLALRIAILGFVARATYGCLNTPQAVRLRWDTITKIEGGTSVLQVGLVPVVLALGGGLVAAVAVSTSTEAARVLLHVIFSRRLQPRLLRPLVRRDLVVPLVRFSGALGLSSLVIIPLRTVERLFVARFGSVSSVAYYSLAATVATMLSVFPMAICQPLLPAFTRLWSTGERERLRSLYGGAIRSVLTFTVPAAVLLCVFARPAFTIWAGAEYGRRSTGPFYILVIGLAANAIAYPAANLLLAAHRPAIQTWYYGVQLVPYVALAALLTYWYGPMGAAFAYSARMMVDWVFFSLAVRRVTGLSVSPLPEDRRAYWRALAILVVPNLVVVALTPRVAPRIIVCLCSVGWYLAVVLTKVLNTQEMQWMHNLVKGIRSSLSARSR